MERDRVPELDLLRFTAAVSVVLFHATHWPTQPNLLTQVFTFGALGVPPMYASLFAGGCFLYLIRSRGATARRLILFAASVPLSMYWTLQYQAKYTHSTTLGTQLTVMAIILGMSIVLLLLALRWWSLPRVRLWFWLGCLTYPLYLTHAKPGHSVFLRLGGDE